MGDKKHTQPPQEQTMTSAVIDIPVQNFAYLLLLVLPVLIIQFRWKLNTGKSIYALGRMLFQLLAIG